MQHENRFVWLDLIRGLSALVVCAGHLQAAMFLPYRQVSGAGLAEQGFYLLTGFGYQAVMVFFVLSGFFVGGSVLRRGARFSPRDYAIARVSRLWTVLLPALAFTVLIDALILEVDASLFAGTHHAQLGSGPHTAADYDASPLALLGNALFLQTIYVPSYGSNGVLWSLANEFWYYVMFPLLTVTLGMSGVAVAGRVFAALALLAVVIVFAHGLMVGFVVWLFGVGVFEAYRRDLWSRWTRLLRWAGAALLAVALVDARLGITQARLGVPGELTVGLAFSLFLLGLRDLSLPTRARRGLIRTATCPWSCSFTCRCSPARNGVSVFCPCSNIWPGWRH